MKLFLGRSDKILKLSICIQINWSKKSFILKERKVTILSNIIHKKRPENLFQFTLKNEKRIF